MKGKANSYLAILLVVVIGVGAALLLMRIVTANSLSATLGGSEAKYDQLKESILKQ